MSQPMQAEAELALDEGLKVAPISAARLVSNARLSWYPTLGATLALVLGGVLYIGVPMLAAAAGRHAWQDTLLAVLGLVQLMLVAVGLAIGWNRAVRWHQRAFLAAVRERGAPATQRYVYRIEDEGLVAESARTRHMLRWQGVLELFPGPDHWLILQDTLTFNIPRRAFATPADEAAFVREALARMTPEARERSREAREFIGT